VGIVGSLALKVKDGTLVDCLCFKDFHDITVNAVYHVNMQGNVAKIQAKQMRISYQSFEMTKSCI